ncbi:MAG: glycosyltransferase family 2 protein [Nitrospirae bacterium]|nr:glycosyltransferase family 2 protein [Nitrospirota bacterium]MBI5694225.1 glycosyltransferase family 2 protein [Nitrospirota bacterium]
MISVIIPAYNEADSIAGVVDALRAVMEPTGLSYEVIVVDDGSTDGTAASLVGKEVTIMTHPENKGYGASLKTGIRGAGGDTIVITDADGTYPVSEIPGLVRAMDEEGYDMVVGARTGKDVNIPLVRRPAKWILKKLADYLSETKIPDLNSGLRAFRKDLAFKYFHLLPSGFSFTTTITLALLSDGYNVKFTPIDYLSRAGGKSKIRPRDFTNFMLLIVRVICYFNPLKVFLPVSLVFIGWGSIHIVETMLREHRVTEAGLLAVLLGFQMAFMGLITDVMVRRDRWVK